MHTLTTLSPGLSLPFMSNPIRTAVVPDGVGVFEGVGGGGGVGLGRGRLSRDGLSCSDCVQAGTTVAVGQSVR